MTEIEVYRTTTFEKNANYAYTLYTRREGKWPYDRYFVDESQLIYLGRHIESERWGFGDGSGGSETFIDDVTGKLTKVEYDYDGKTCFRKVGENNRL